MKYYKRGEKMSKKNLKIGRKASGSTRANGGEIQRECSFWECFHKEGIDLYMSSLFVSCSRPLLDGFLCTWKNRRVPKNYDATNSILKTQPAEQSQSTRRPSNASSSGLSSGDDDDDAPNTKTPTQNATSTSAAINANTSTAKSANDKPSSTINDIPKLDGSLGARGVTADVTKKSNSSSSTEEGSKDTIFSKEEEASPAKMNSNKALIQDKTDDSKENETGKNASADTEKETSTHTTSSAELKDKETTRDGRKSSAASRRASSTKRNSSSTAPTKRGSTSTSGNKKRASAELSEKNLKAKSKYGSSPLDKSVGQDGESTRAETQDSTIFSEDKQGSGNKQDSYFQLLQKQLAGAAPATNNTTSTVAANNNNSPNSGETLVVRAITLEEMMRMATNRGRPSSSRGNIQMDGAVGGPAACCRVSLFGIPF